MKLFGHNMNKITIDANPVLLKRLRECEETNERLTREVQVLVFDLEKSETKVAKLQHKMLRLISEKNQWQKAYENVMRELGGKHDGNRT